MIMRSLLPTLCVLVSLVRGAAQVSLPELQVDSRVYTNVTVFGANATDLYFRHAQGLANVKLKYLSPELQQRFGYDPVEAAKVEKEQAEEEKRFTENLAKSISAEAIQRLRGPETLGDASLADPVSERSLLNQPLPELTVEKWLTEKPALRNKYAIIFFWTTRSAAARRYIPEFNALQRKLTNELVVVGIALDGEQAVVQMAPPLLEFASALDSKKALAARFGVTSVPTILLVDARNIIRYQGHPAALSERELRRLMGAFPGT